MKTTWKAVPGYEGIYEVSDRGQVRCLVKRRSAHKKLPFIMKPGIVNRRRQVWLWKDHGKKGFQLHRLVILAFVGPCPPLKEVNHKDGNPANNALGNLEYVTKSENHLHRYRVLGQKHNQGSEHGMHKLTEKDVLKIRELCARGVFHIKIAERFHVCLQTIAKISCRMTWRHI